MQLRSQTLPLLVQLLFSGCLLVAGEHCPVILPQNSDSTCAEQRRSNLADQQSRYKLHQAPGFPVPGAELTGEEMKAIIMSDPFIRPHGLVYGEVQKDIVKILQEYLASQQGRAITSLNDFAELRQHFRDKVQENHGEYTRLPSDYEPFQNDVTQLMSDEFFAQQRLAGANPMSLRVVSHHKENGVNVGLSWDELNQSLNPNFDWEHEVQQALGSKIALTEAITEHFVYALRYEMCDDLQKTKGLSKRTERTRSPIAIFVSSDEVPGGLKPVAIQMDHKPASKVLTPRDGDTWMRAKLNVQTTDMTYGQIAEHLTNCHFLTEVLCVAMKRHFPSQHPVHQIMKYHCREVMLCNVFGREKLLAEDGITQIFYAHGVAGTRKLLQRADSALSWDTTDFKGNLQKRGIKSDRIPYFPYRDDGNKIYDAINAFVKEYVGHYYKSNHDVQNDPELQAFANEVSAEGKLPPDGGDGKLKGFPSSVTSVRLLENILTRWIWQLTGQHASIGYEISDYASYIPNVPTKTYKGMFGTQKFVDRNTAAMQVAFSMGISSLRFDRLFDYGNYLDDKFAGRIVNDHHCRLETAVQKDLEDENDARKNAGQLPYPFLLPKWIPNGIQT